MHPHDLGFVVVLVFFAVFVVNGNYELTRYKANAAFLLSEKCFTASVMDFVTSEKRITVLVARFSINDKRITGP